MAKLSRDLSTPSGGAATLHPRETVFTTASLAAVNAQAIIPADGVSQITLDVRGTYVGTLTVEGSVDATNWTPIAIRPVNVASIAYLLVTASTAQGVFIGKCVGYRLVRVRQVAYTSGLATISLVGHIGTYEDSLIGNTAPLIVTSVGAAGAAVTLTLPAPGAGLRQYLTYLSINRFAAAALTAAAAPVTVTTTNLPGSLAFSFAADAALQGTLDRWREDFSYPVVASAQNTAVTIVAPVTTGVIWRTTVGYYIAP